MTYTVKVSKEHPMTDEAVLDAAIAWRVRLAVPAASDADWAQFTDWLEADPAHGDAYDRVALADLDYADALAATPVEAELASNDNEAASWFKRRGVMALAASAVLALIAMPFLTGSRDLETFQTRPGETRTIALNDGSRIELNGGTRIALDRKDDRYARLEIGEAAFTIRHDAANPFTLHIGDSELVDVGTLFNVRSDDEGLEVAVGEGVVRYNPDNEAVLIAAGSQLVLAANAAKPVVSATEPGTVASWRTGRLSYRDAPISRIALDLSRALGSPVSVDPKASGRRFSGTIQIDRVQAVTMRKVQDLLGVKATPSRSGWRLTI
jgi:transmembrane sensor